MVKLLASTRSSGSGISSRDFYLPKDDDEEARRRRNIKLSIMSKY